MLSDGLSRAISVKRFGRNTFAAINRVWWRRADYAAMQGRTQTVNVGLRALFIRALSVLLDRRIARRHQACELRCSRL